MTTTPIKRVSVVIVNYGTPELTIAGVKSVLEQSKSNRHVDVHVLDNASPDDSPAKLEAAHAQYGWGPRVKIYIEKTNHGFGRGNNVVLTQLAAQETPPDAVFLLNPDAFLTNDAVDILASALETGPSVGFAGAGVNGPDGTSVTAAFRFPSVLSEFSAALNFGPIARLLSKWTVPLPPDTPGGKVDWVTGAAVMIKMDAGGALEYFDPGFFLYHEEVDMMKRGAALGWDCLYVPNARVTHIEGEATGIKTATRIPGYRYDSWQYYFRKNHGRPVALLAASGRVLGSIGDRLISLLRGRPSSVPAFFFQDFWSHAVRPLLYNTSRKSL